VDLAFPLRGQQLARDHAQALYDALAGRLAWWPGPQEVGVHPIKVVPGEGELGWLSRRARLMIRVAASQQAAFAPLPGSNLQLDGQRVELGEPRPMHLIAHGTLKAAFVAAADDDEQGFLLDVADQLRQLEVDAQVVCGRRQQLRRHNHMVHGFSLMLHGLNPTDSLKIQRAGLGPHRALGCGIFVPHRSAAAVGG
jgi:CRISPR-associated protein Cas6